MATTRCCRETGTGAEVGVKAGMGTRMEVRVRVEGPVRTHAADGHPAGHQALEHPPLAAGCSQALRLWRFRRAHRLSRRHFHWDDQIHGGEAFLIDLRFRRMLIPVRLAARLSARTHNGKGVYHLRGCLVDGALHPRARSKPLPVPERSSARGPHHAHHSQRGTSSIGTSMSHP